MSKRLLNVTIVIVLMGASAAYGFFVHRNQIFPYPQAQQLKYWLKGVDESSLNGEEQEGEEVALTPSERAMFEEIDPFYLQTDVDGLISIHTASDAESLRLGLVDLVWGKEGLPQRQPDEVQRDVVKNQVKGVDRVDRLLIKMDFGLESVAYHYIPAERNNKLILWHEDHSDTVHYDYIQQFVDQGYSVIYFCMPLYCENTNPVVSVPHLGDIRLDFHDYMAFLQPEQGHTLKYFLEPVVVGLNYLQQEYGYRHIAMAGYSGGGWTTTMMAAIDPRIQSSFPAAGSYPIFLREYRDRSHYEQQLPEVYTLANFLELYVLGGYGEGRAQMQIINQYDPCCYAGIKGQVYADTVSARVEQLGGGSWSLFIDPYTEHGISTEAMAKIFDYLAGK